MRKEDTKKRIKTKCPRCGSEDLSITSEPSYICNACQYPDKIKYVIETKEKEDNKY